jgi:protein transport protein SEC39
LKTFQTHFPDSTSLRQIEALISATHALSFYSLTLLHGVPFQPVGIRVHPDPLSLIEKVLDQNPGSYAKLDDLVSIGHNLVKAGLPIPLPESDPRLGDSSPTPEERASVTAERRIISMAISSALISNDFGTAYSYVITRLTPPSLLPNSPSSSKATVRDDTSWHAAYNAGRYRSTTSNSINVDLQSQITRLSQQMELISLALMLAPPDPLPEILGAWRRCDEEMTVLHTREAEEAEEWDQRGDKAATLPLLSTVPGGFGPTNQELDAFENEKQRIRRARAHSPRPKKKYEEVPMGLFDVARSAAQAIRKNAFPLHSRNAVLSGSNELGRQQQHQQRERTQPSEESGADVVQSGTEGGASRVRKRDMVSNMVTGSLASGIGWVLGAQPINR